MTLQRSALHNIAVAAGSDFQDSYGWEMPTVYSDVAAEYLAATSGAAVYDASYTGRLKATGEDGLDLLNRLSTNKVIDLQPGQGAPTILTTDRGRILDLIIVLNVGDHLLLLTSPGTQQSVIQWLDKYTIMEDLAVEDISESTAMLAVWGPDALGSLETATGLGLAELPLYNSVEALLGGTPVRVVSTRISELPGYYVITSNEEAPAAWQVIVESGARPIGTQAYEAARINYSLPVHGREIGDEFNPLEAGLIGSIDFAKGCYIGQEVIARLDTYQKVQKYLVKLAFEPGASVSPGTSLKQDGRVVGQVTSVATVPTSNDIIGLAYVRTKNAIPGARLELEPPATGWAQVQDLPQLFGPGE